MNCRKGSRMKNILFLILFTPFFFHTSVAQISNVECATAISIPSLPFSISQNTRSASENLNDPVQSCQDSTKNGKTVWFKYTSDTTRVIIFSTIGSQPFDYDITMSVFTGTCGSLVEIKCNDDSLDSRHSVVRLNAQAGITYYIMIGEWGGGGPNGGVPTGGDLVLNVFAPVVAPVFKGPKKGIANNGVIISTDIFPNVTAIPSSRPKIKKPNINKRIPRLPLPEKMVEPIAPYGSNYIEDRSAQQLSSIVSRPVALLDFEGIPQTNFIPPDPILAVGPNHVMVAVNSTFRIFDKSGNILKTIDADDWFHLVVSGASSFDPILMYDHFDNRWLLVMLHVADAEQKAYIMISVSDDSDPLGTWYNWGTFAHMLGDSVVGNWSDYARVGFDKDAVYITSNQFGFVSNFAYSKLRIIPKSELYANNSKAITWNDFWDFRDPDNTDNLIFGIRPSITFGNPGRQFLLNDSPYLLGTFFTLWTLENSLSNPMLSATNVPVVQYAPSPDADQREGSPIPIEAFGADIRNEPVYRDSALWVVHAVASGETKKYSAVRYIKFDPFQKNTLEDVTFGLEGYWHTYPALMVNKNSDLVITYSRSGEDEFIGAFMTGRKKHEAPNLSPSVMLREGRANYVVDYGSGRNRWGDYNGIGLDPTDELTIWTHTEFAASKNKWGTWVAKTQIGPVAGSKLTTNRSFINFGTKNVGSSSDTITITLTNDGIDSLYISSLLTTSQNFSLVNVSLPIIIPSLGTYALKVFFKPTSGGNFTDSILFCGAQACITLNTLATLSGTGFQIVPAQLGTVYAFSGSVDGGKIYSMNTSSGSVEYIANSGISQIVSARIHPTSKELIGLNPTGNGSTGSFYRISASGTIFQKISNIAITNAKGFTFLNDSIIYLGDFAGRIYSVNINTGSSTQIANTGLRISGLALDTNKNSVWISVRATTGTLDGIYKFNLTTNTFSLIGQTGLGIANADLLFDANGKLYCLAGIGATENKLLVIDTTNGSALKILATGKSNLQAIALNPDAPANIAGDKSILPNQFVLYQNYPNPFNPLTSIRFEIAKQTFVTLKVYDVLGKVVQVLAEGNRNPGIYQEYFAATGLASGVYYYRLKADKFSETKKMLVIQ